MILRGNVRLEGKSIAKSIQLGPNSYFGEVGLVTNEPSDTKAFVESDNCILAFIDQDTFFQKAIPVKDILTKKVQIVRRRSIKKQISKQKVVLEIEEGVVGGPESSCTLVGIPLCVNPLKW